MLTFCSLCYKIKMHNTSGYRKEPQRGGAFASLRFFVLILVRMFIFLLIAKICVFLLTRVWECSIIYVK
mgnify:CR=1 FL=1